MKTVIEMAKEAGFMVIHEGDVETGPWYECFTEEIERFAELVRAEEREACAKVCEELVPDISRTANDASVWDVATFDCAAAIRSRSSEH